MQFCIAGVSYKTATVDIRERLSFEEADLSNAYQLLLAKDEISECVILSTCNRVEIYAMINGDRVNILKDFIRDYHKFNQNLDDIWYSKIGEAALEHLCMVATGLDSMVLGEPQIFGQVKDAYQKAIVHNGVRHAFEHVFPQVFSLVKKIRSHTAIGEKNTSVSYTAVQLAHSIFNDVKDKKVLILGAGETGELTLRNLVSAGIKNVIVANRTFQKAVEVAERFNGTPIMMHEIDEYLSEIDILISSISVPEYVIKELHVSKFDLVRENRVVFLVDISVPRSIDPLVGKYPGVHLFNIDDLKAVVDANIQLRKAESDKCIQLIKEKVPKLVDYLQSCDILPTLVSIRTKAEEIRKDNMEKVIENLSISSKEKEILDSLTKSIVNKILNHSEIKIREFATNSKHV